MTTSSDLAVPDTSALVARIAALLQQGVLSAGDCASLRRMDPRQPSAAFFKVTGLVLNDHLPPSAPDLHDAETRWASIVRGLSLLGGLHGSERDVRSRSLGTVLAATKYSEHRFARLVQADVEWLLDDLPALAAYLAARNVEVDWSGAARLVLSAGRGAEEERVRRRLARDYYGLLARQADAQS